MAKLERVPMRGKIAISISLRFVWAFVINCNNSQGICGVFLDHSETTIYFAVVFNLHAGGMNFSAGLQERTGLSHGRILHAARVHLLAQSRVRHSSTTILSGDLSEHPLYFQLDENRQQVFD